MSCSSKSSGLVVLFVLLVPDEVYVTGFVCFKTLQKSRDSLAFKLFPKTCKISTDLLTENKSRRELHGCLARWKAVNKR